MQAIARKRRGLAGAAGALAARHLPRTGRGAAVLCYHDVGVDPANQTDYYLSPDRLRDQLEAIASWGLRFVDLDDLVDRLDRGAALDGLVAVTFDDALLGVLEDALPVLTDLGVPATVFVVTGVRGEEPGFWPGARRTLRTDELRALTAAGVRLGSHTRLHPTLPELDDDQLREELARSREELRELTDTASTVLAYPFGDHDERVRRAARDAGFCAACTFTFGRVVAGTDSFALPRFCMSARHHRARLAYQLARPASAW